MTVTNLRSPSAGLGSSSFVPQFEQNFDSDGLGVEQLGQFTHGSWQLS